MFCLIEDRCVASPIMPSATSADHHTTLQASQHGASYNCCPCMDGMVDLHGLRRAQGNGVCRSLSIRRWRRGIVVCLHAAVQIVTLPKAANQHNTTHQASSLPDALHLTLDQVYHLFHDWLEDLFDLLYTHDQEARIESGLFIIWKSWEWHIHFRVLLLIEVSLHELLEVLQPHIPGLLFLLTHPIVSFRTYPSLDMVFEPVVEEC